MNLKFSKNKFLKNGSLAFVFLALVLIIFILYSVISSGNIGKDLFSLKKEITEGVLVDKSFIGIQRVFPTNYNTSDLDRSISSLIYEPLFRVDQDENIIPVLAENFSQENYKYTINLKQNIKFSNGQSMTANDVISTINAIRTKFNDSATKTIFDELKYDAPDDFTITLDVGKYIPTLFEDLSFGIMPASELDKVADKFIGLEISRNPIGTGPMKKNSSSEKEYVLVKNEFFRSAENIKIDKYIFKFFKSQTQLERSLLGKSVTFTKNIRLNKLKVIDGDVLKNDNYYLTNYESNVFANRYWSLYFNLKDEALMNDTEKDTLKVFQDNNVRRAINLGINKSIIASSISTKSQPMQRALSELSWVNLGNSNPYLFDNSKSDTLLNESGWLMVEGKRQKNQQVLEFKITYFQNETSNEVINLIIEQLKSIGIQAVADPISDASHLNDQILKTKQFEVVLLGTETYIDPDRSRLWLESQISQDGLNISSYRSSEKVQDIITGSEISRVDDALNRARSIEDKETRIKLYKDFEKIIDKDSPVIFLYQPNINIISNKALTMPLDNLVSPQSIYYNLELWNLN
ncbi:ABC transporter substrate-binding protein [bacterium]|nr:MAG: ABC transporter substrate-binding protein [bacterium]